MTKMSNFCGDGDITKIYVVEPTQNSIIGNLTADTITVQGDLYVDGDIINCDPDSVLLVNTISACTDNTINVGSNLTPLEDGVVSVGTQFKRYREVNMFSGYSTIWASSVRVVTPEVTLGYDSEGELRILNANNSILQYDSLNGGTY